VPGPPVDVPGPPGPTVPVPVPVPVPGKPLVVPVPGPPVPVPGPPSPPVHVPVPFPVPGAPHYVPVPGPPMKVPGPPGPPDIVHVPVPFPVPAGDGDGGGGISISGHGGGVGGSGSGTSHALSVHIRHHTSVGVHGTLDIHTLNQIKEMIRTQNIKITTKHQWLVDIALNTEGLLQWTLHILGCGHTAMNDFASKLLFAIVAAMHDLNLIVDTAVFAPCAVPGLVSPNGPPPITAPLPCAACAASPAGVPCTACGVPAPLPCPNGACTAMLHKAQPSHPQP